MGVYGHVSTCVTVMSQLHAHTGHTGSQTPCYTQQSLLRVTRSFCGLWREVSRGQGGNKWKCFPEKCSHHSDRLCVWVHFVREQNRVWGDFSTCAHASWQAQGWRAKQSGGNLSNVALWLLPGPGLVANVLAVLQGPRKRAGQGGRCHRVAWPGGLVLDLERPQE